MTSAEHELMIVHRASGKVAGMMRRQPNKCKHIPVEDRRERKNLRSVTRINLAANALLLAAARESCA
jgi:hypothetical protein